MRPFLVGLRLRELRARRLQIGERGDQVVLRLHKLARMDDKERSTGLDHIAEHGNYFDDPPGEMREHWGRQIIVNRDRPLGRLLRTKDHRNYRFDLEPRPLCCGRLECSWRGGAVRWRRVL